MNYKEGFSWCCSSWSFHEATGFMAREKPMTHGYSIDIERLIAELHARCEKPHI